MKKSLKSENLKKEENISFDSLLNKNFPPIIKEFSSFLNILEIDTFIKQKFNFEYEHKLKLLRNQLDIEKHKLNKKLFAIERITIENEIHNIESSISEILNQNKLKEYQNDTKNILDLYKDIGPKKKVISFTMSKSDKSSPELPNASNQEQLLLIEKYLSIAKQYHNINIQYPTSKLNCSGCGFNLKKILEDDKGIIVCPVCGVEKLILIKNTIISDNKNNISREGYEDRENFEKALYRFQGKQINKPPERLYKELDNYFKSFNPPLPTGDIIKSYPLLPNGSKKGTSRSMILKALSETGNSVFYEDVNLITHIYWGWTLPDLSAEEANILNDYDITQEVYKKIQKDRKSSLNTQYRLWQHLRIRGFNYPIEVFKIVKTPDILAEHDRIMEIMCRESDLPFTPAL
jgi:rubrerythrin